jgi:hypothetical protein
MTMIIIIEVAADKRIVIPVDGHRGSNMDNDFDTSPPPPPG